MAVAPLNNNTFVNTPINSNIDLDGGTLLDVKQYEEIDEKDGCRVQVIEYHILSADGQEESTRTCRRKLVIECNQSSKRTEYRSDGEAIVEEKTERLVGDIGDLKKSFAMNHDAIDFPSEDNMVINEVIAKTQENFVKMLSDQKSEFVKSFPDLFSEMRTDSALVPSTEVETIVNPDGSTTTRTRSSRAFSTHFSKQEMYINGVKQVTKSKFRAFMEYKGPEGGFRVKLTDNPDGDISEEEFDDLAEQNDDLQSEISEVSESHSATIGTGLFGRVPKLQATVKNRLDKAWHAAKELVDSEQRYVEKLHLLSEIFRNKVVDAKLLEKDKLSALFANLSSLYQFHNTHLLPSLLECCRDWHTNRRISGVLRKKAPFLKMYSEYTNNYKRAIKTFEECCKKKRRFAQIVQEIQADPNCDNLSLISHLICPVQRVMRYQLLLQEYKKHLKPSDADYEDTTEALNLVLDAAGHANEMMRKLDRHKNVLEVQELLGNSVSLVSPGRELIKKGKILKLSSNSEKTEDRYMHLFNDLLLLASERSLPGFGKLKVRAIFDAVLTKIYEGDNLERENSFYVRGSDSEAGPSRCIELLAESSKEKADWINSIWSAIGECVSKKNSFASKAVTLNLRGTKLENRNCAMCDADFTFLSRGTICLRCKQKFCKKCMIRRTEFNNQPVCTSCSRITDFGQINGSKPSTNRIDILAIASNEGEILHASHVNFKGSLNKLFRRYFVVRKDFCLYSYENEWAERALSMLPLPGCEVKMSGEKLAFTIRHMNRLYTVTANTEQDQIRWMAVLDLTSNAVLRDKKAA